MVVCLLAMQIMALVDVSSEEEGLVFFLTHLCSSELSAAAVLNDILSLAV